MERNNRIKTRRSHSVHSRAGKRKLTGSEWAHHRRGKEPPPGPWVSCGSHHGSPLRACKSKLSHINITMNILLCIQMALDRMHDTGKHGFFEL